MLIPPRLPDLAFARRYRPCAPAVRSARRGALRRRPGLGDRGTRPPRLRAEASSPPRFPGDPSDACPGRRPRRWTEGSTLLCLLSLAFHGGYRVGHRNVPRFRGSVPRPASSLCTLRLSTQHSLPGGGATPCPGGTFTRWISSLSFLCGELPPHFPLSQGLAWRTPPRGSSSRPSLRSGRTLTATAWLLRPPRPPWFAPREIKLVGALAGRRY
jgi:hypothetical protein